MININNLKHNLDEALAKETDKSLTDWLRNKRQDMSLDIATLKIGDKVNYTPFEGCSEELIENGMVKEIPDHTNTEVRVVFHCAGEWDRFMEYTSQLTPIKNLKLGWKH